MKLKRILLVVLLAFNLFANDEINVNFKDLKISDLIKITSKIINKNGTTYSYLNFVRIF